MIYYVIMLHAIHISLLFITFSEFIVRPFCSSETRLICSSNHFTVRR